jgi:nucleotide-binding universal stress UspA family protein
MLAVHTILHPTDFSDRSRYALALASALARDYGARLIVLHAVAVPTVVYGDGVVVAASPGVLLASAREQLDGLPLPHTGVRAERRVEEGDAVEVILRVAQEVRADLIVMGTHGRTGLGRLLMGSVAELVVRKAGCPVLTVKAPFPETAPEAQPADAGGVPERGERHDS